MRTKNELRCICSRKPLLAFYGVDRGRAYVHVKVFKQGRTFGNIVVHGAGMAEIECRECQRWTKLRLSGVQSGSEGSYDGTPSILVPMMKPKSSTGT